MTKCSVCGERAIAKEYCAKHYQRFRKYGDPNYTKAMPKRISLDERLRFHGWSVGNQDCWLWSRVFSQGYGRISVDGRGRKAHVVAYEAWVGPIPAGLKVCHKCDVRNCINPDHLFLGTQADNMEDMVNKGRARNQWTGPLAAKASKDGDANVCK